MAQRDKARCARRKLELKAAQRLFDKRRAMAKRALYREDKDPRDLPHNETLYGRQGHVVGDIYTDRDEVVRQRNNSPMVEKEAPEPLEQPLDDAATATPPPVDEMAAMIAVAEVMGMTVAKIRDELEELGVAYPKKDVKARLAVLLVKARLANEEE